MFYKSEQIQILLNIYDDLAHNDQGTFDEFALQSSIYHLPHMLQESQKC